MLRTGETDISAASAIRRNGGLHLLLLLLLFITCACIDGYILSINRDADKITSHARARAAARNGWSNDLVSLAQIWI